MSPAERFVRHHRQQTDRAISQAYARLAGDRLASASFHELLHCVRDRARRLLDAPVADGRHRGVDTLVNLSQATRAHVRRIDDWPGTPGSWRECVSSLAGHLVCRYPVPRFLSASWYAADAYADRKRAWFVAHARGSSFRSLDLPIVMVGPMPLAGARVAAFLFALMALGVFWAVLRYTWYGLALRATSQSRVGVQTAGLDDYHREITAKGYRFMRPGIETAPWNARVMEVIDPFGNRLRFNEPIEPAPR